MHRLSKTLHTSAQHMFLPYILLRNNSTMAVQFGKHFINLKVDLPYSGTARKGPIEKCQKFPKTAGKFEYILICGVNGGATDCPKNLYGSSTPLHRIQRSLTAISATLI